jgi:hypothetical protein
LLIAMDQDYARDRSKRSNVAPPNNSVESVAFSASQFCN